MSATAMKALYPGTLVEIRLGAQGQRVVTATVYPVGFKHLQKFTVLMMRVGETLSKASATVRKDVDEDELKKAMGNEVIKALVPIVMDEMMGLVAECVVFDDENVTMDSLAHYHIAPIIEAWIAESFLPLEKLRPWIEAINRLLNQVTGKPMNLWGTLSQSLSKKDIVSETSATETTV